MERKKMVILWAWHSVIPKLKRKISVIDSYLRLRTCLQMQKALTVWHQLFPAMMGWEGWGQGQK